MGRLRTTTGNIAYAKYQLKRSIIESTLDDHYTENDHKDALDFFGGCAFCGNKTTTRMDHLIPVFKFGDFIRSNVVPSCQECDDSKGQKDYQDWMRNSTSPKSLRNRGISKEIIEQRIRIIEKWQGSYRAKSEKQLFGQHHDQYIEILKKMDQLCIKARQLVTKVKPQVTIEAEQKFGTVADRIRSYAVENYINLAREKKRKAVTIRSGDVHSALGLRQNHANVCQSLRGDIFQNMAGVKLISESGPKMGGNTYFRYRV